MVSPSISVVPAAHHAADRRDRDVVDDQHVGRIEFALDVVEGDDGLPRIGEAHREIALDPGAVVGVHRVTEFEHDVVGDIDGGRDRPDTAQHQATTQPPRRQRFGSIPVTGRSAKRLTPVPGSMVTGRAGPSTGSGGTSAGSTKFRS